MPSINVFDSDISSIVYFIAGALVSAIISYLFSSLREKKLLKLRLQIDTADSLYGLIRDCQDKSAKLSLMVELSFNNYNINLKSKNGEIVDSSKQSIDNKFKQWDEEYLVYFHSILSILYFIESREIILIKFREFHFKINTYLSNLIKLNSEIFSVRLKITNLLFSMKYIDDQTSNEFKSLYNKFKEIKGDISMYMLDLQIGLQNEFYKKIFHNKISERKPTDPKYKPIKPKKNKISIIG